MTAYIVLDGGIKLYLFTQADNIQEVGVNV